MLNRFKTYLSINSLFFQEFDKYGLLLSSMIGVGLDTLDAAYDFPAICPYLDFLNLMMYDLHFYLDGFTGHHTSQYNHPNLGTDANSLVNNTFGLA